MDIEYIDIIQIADISTMWSTINSAKAYKIMADKILNKFIFCLEFCAVLVV